MICPFCKDNGKGMHEMEMRRSFGRDHHWQCETCNRIVMVADRIASADRGRVLTDEDDLS